MHPSTLTAAELDRLSERVGPSSDTPGMLYVEIGEGMSNQVDRFGILPKKTLHGDRQYIRGIRMVSDRDQYPENSSMAGDGSTQAGESGSSHADTCQTFLHPTYGQEKFRSESGQYPRTRLSLAALSEGARNCGFCAILYQGIYSRRNRWITEWAICSWLEAHPDCDFGRVMEQESWLHDYEDEIEREKSIDESTVDLIIEFSKESKAVDIQMAMAEHAVPRARTKLTLSMLEFYSLIAQPSPWVAFGPRPHTITDILRDGGLLEMVDWVNNCKENHSACNFAMDPGVPTRLIRIAESDNGPFHLHLHDTDPSRRYRYVALSHCWARSNPLKTTRENLAQHQQRIPFDLISPVFDNAFHLTWCLGVNYIWIDSLCIIQNDAVEWETESVKMGAVYSNALVVFASHGYDFGLQREALRPLEDPWRPDDPPVFCRNATDHKNFFLPPLRTDSWFTRGWCMQERLLARRVLHFGGKTDEIWFECNSELTCECERSEESRDVLHKLTLKELRASLLCTIDTTATADRDELWRYYVRFCEDYSAGSLTFSIDSMPAMSGLMSELAPHLGNYFAGLWEHNLLLSLQWEAWDTRECVRTSQYVAPSFSWASRSGGVIWYADPYNLPTDDTHEFAEVVDVSCTLAGQDKFGRVSAGRLTLRGCVSKMAVKSTKMVEPDGSIELETGGVGECYVTLDSLQDAEDIEVGDVLTCLDIMRDRANADRETYVSALVLLPSRLINDCYRRVGFSTMLTRHFDNTEAETVSIV